MYQRAETATKEKQRPPWVHLRLPMDIQLPTIMRSPNTSSKKELGMEHIPLTLPNVYEPILPQLNEFLSLPHRSRLGQDSIGPFGTLGSSQDRRVIHVKEHLARLPSRVSLEARAVFLTTLLDKFYPTLLGMTHKLPSTYDYGKDRYLAREVYGGNGLYKAVEEWLALSEGKFPGYAQPVELPWSVMHVRHTLLNNPDLLDKPTDIDAMVEMVLAFEQHFKRPHEDIHDYIPRMTSEIMKAHKLLQQMSLLPKYRRIRGQLY